MCIGRLYCLAPDSNSTGSHLGGVTVSVLAIRPKDRWFKPGRRDGYLRAIKIRTAPSFGGEVKPSASRRKILWHVKNSFEV
jgi:hypothetical protein